MLLAAAEVALLEMMPAVLRVDVLVSKMELLLARRAVMLLFSELSFVPRLL